MERGDGGVHLRELKGKWEWTWLPEILKELVKVFSLKKSDNVGEDVEKDRPSFIVICKACVATGKSSWKQANSNVMQEWEHCRAGEAPGSVAIES